MDEAGYVRKWLKRGWMRFLLRHHNIKIDFKSVTVRTFIDIWPDEHKLLLRLLSDPKGQSTNANLALTVGDALENLGYEDDEEDLSMHACLIDDIDSQTVLRRKGPDWIPRNWVELRKRLAALLDPVHAHLEQRVRARALVVHLRRGGLYGQRRKHPFPLTHNDGRV